MVYVVAHNVTSPLGLSTAANYQAVKEGCSALCRYHGRWGLPEPFAASLFSEEQTQALAEEGLTRFEALALHSVRRAIEGVALDVASPGLLFVLSTTKANVELLGEWGDAALLSPATAAQRVARRLGIVTTPVVVCSACISGVSALILASRLIETGCYETAIVCGADVQTRFTVSGFQSLKAVAQEPCRPFDLERTGLNLGEAAATVVLQKSPLTAHHAPFIIREGAIRNDAFHISSPAKNGEGAYRALRAVLPDEAARITFINAHGTATMFNDQMESVAIERAGLANIPVNGLKGYYGHTLGAAGLLETVISFAALADGTVLATRGFEERGVSGRISVTTHNTPATADSFVKMISGFGGGNSALLCSVSPLPLPPATVSPPITVTHSVTVTPTTVTIDGAVAEGSTDLTDLYKRFVGDYPRFYKMDGLSRLGFIASELLLQAEASQRFTPREDRAVVLFSASSCIATDRKYWETIAPIPHRSQSGEHLGPHTDNFFPSPSLFLYTLPNIVTGEIALRNHYHGETGFYILPHRDRRLMRLIATAAFCDHAVTSIITGWTDYYDATHYEAHLSICFRPN